MDAIEIAESIVLSFAILMLAPLTIAELIDHQHCAAVSCPRHPHVLKLALCFGLVVTVDNDKGGHRLSWIGRQIQVAGYRHSVTAPVHEVLDLKSIAAYSTGNYRIDAVSPFIQLTE